MSEYLPASSGSPAIPSAQSLHPQTLSGPQSRGETFSACTQHPSLELPIIWDGVGLRHQSVLKGLLVILMSHVVEPHRFTADLDFLPADNSE